MPNGTDSLIWFVAASLERSGNRGSAPLQRISMTIGELARRVGFRPSAIRYYELRGIVPRPMRSASEYRLYGSEAESIVRFIQCALQLGFSLEEVIYRRIPQQSSLHRLPQTDRPTSCASGR
jgi:hypothetical protein